MRFVEGADWLMMPARDRAVVELVGRFRQLTARQIGAALFADVASKTPLDRCLKRLVEGRYLMRLRRPIGSEGGGSEPYTYLLGRAGWRLLGRNGEYWAPRAVSRHTLAIAECYVELLAAERRDELVLLRFDVEPACHIRVGGVELTPDAFVEVGIREQDMKYSLWFEVDTGSEHAPVIREKCMRYWRAYQDWERDVFPYVAFIVPDDKRQREIARVIAGGPEEAQRLFHVYLANDLGKDIHRNMRQ